MSENDKKEILQSEMDRAQLDDMTGRGSLPADCTAESADYDARFGEDLDHCRQSQKRPQGDCAATVESGSWCSKADACIRVAIDYRVCFRAEAE
ncbi:MAG: hypothetical protein CW338_01045 [Clostridiales bacterium]|nr:hypothetical protein [Clostridiales bacterium]